MAASRRRWQGVSSSDRPTDVAFDDGDLGEPGEPGEPVVDAASAEPSGAAAASRRPGPSSPGGLRTLRRSPVAAAIVLLLVYVGLSFANNPNGYLGTDTGGKVATLQAMEARGSVDGLDVGYWAEAWDPDGDLHGFWSTVQVDGERWVQVSTVPLVVAARPLWDAGGYRLALLLPMLGGLGCALAARALVRRLGGAAPDDAVAFWLVGLASPVLIYALDLWEHTLGLAAMAWAVVAMLAAVDDDAPIARTAAWGSLAGLLWGIGFSMRTESLLYGAVVTAALCLLTVRRRWSTAVVAGAATAVGVVVGFLANSALERAVLGDTLRAGRASGTAEGFGAEAGTRLEEGLITTFGIDGSNGGIVLGIVSVVALALLIRRSTRAGWEQDRIVVVLGALAIIPVLLGLFSGGLGFVPGLLIASPVAVAGIVFGFAGPARSVAVVGAAIVALPVVWAFQFLGGAGPQWGGRYALTSALLLTVAGVVGLRRADPAVRKLVLGAAMAITVFGFAWMVVRTHGFASAGEDIAAADEPVLIARDVTGFLPREFVAANPDQRWLATLGQDELDRAVEIVEEAGFDRFGLLIVQGESTPDVLGELRRVEVVPIPVVSGVTLEIVRYAR